MKSGTPSESIATAPLQKQVVACYLFWFFFGFVGAHKIYLDRLNRAVLYTALFLVGFFSGGLTWILEGIFLAYDLFTIPLQVKIYNEDLSARLSSDHPPGSRQGTG